MPDPTRIAAHFYIESVTLQGKEWLPDQEKIDEARAQARSRGEDPSYIHDRYFTVEGPRDVGSVHLQAVVRGDVNKEWSSATPWGELKMGILNADAFDFFLRHRGEEVELVISALETKNGVPIVG